MKVKAKHVEAWKAIESEGKHWTVGGYCDITGLIQCRDAYGHARFVHPDTEVTLLDDRGKVWAECAAAIKAKACAPSGWMPGHVSDRLSDLIDRIAQQPPLPGGGE